MSKYEVALSFAGEQRPYVEVVAHTLQSRGISVFYDEFETVRLWGTHLAEELQSVYEGRASLAVMFISADYVEKMWPRHERRAILSRAVEERGEYVLPVRFDGSEVPGFSRDLVYLGAENHPPAELAAMIAEKLGIKPFQGKASDVPPPQMTSLSGEAVFNYANHNGRYVIGHGKLEFETKWSKASNTSIHVVNDLPSINVTASRWVAGIGQKSTRWQALLRWATPHASGLRRLGRWWCSATWRASMQQYEYWILRMILEATTVMNCGSGTRSSPTVPTTLPRCARYSAQPTRL